MHVTVSLITLPPPAVYLSGPWSGALHCDVVTDTRQYAEPNIDIVWQLAATPTYMYLFCVVSVCTCMSVGLSGVYGDLLYFIFPSLSARDDTHNHIYTQCYFVCFDFCFVVVVGVG